MIRLRRQRTRPKESFAGRSLHALRVDLGISAETEIRRSSIDAGFREICDSSTRTKLLNRVRPVQAAQGFTRCGNGGGPPAVQQRFPAAAVSRGRQ